MFATKKLSNLGKSGQKMEKTVGTTRFVCIIFVFFGRLNIKTTSTKNQQIRKKLAMSSTYFQHFFLFKQHLNDHFLLSKK